MKDKNRSIFRNGNRYKYSFVDKKAVMILRSQDLKRSIDYFLDQVSDVIRKDSQWRAYNTPYVIENINKLLDDILPWIGKDCKKRMLKKIKDKCLRIESRKDFIGDEEYLLFSKAAEFMDMTSSTFKNVIKTYPEIRIAQKEGEDVNRYNKNDLEKLREKLLNRRLNFKKEALID